MYAQTLLHCYSSLINVMLCEARMWHLKYVHTCINAVGEDYRPGTLNLTFASDTDSRSVSITIVDDTEVEKMEIFFVQLLPTETLSPQVTLSTDIVSITITDDDCRFLSMAYAHTHVCTHMHTHTH